MGSRCGAVTPQSGVVGGATQQCKVKQLAYRHQSIHAHHNNLCQQHLHNRQAGTMLCCAVVCCVALRQCIPATHCPGRVSGAPPGINTTHTTHQQQFDCRGLQARTSSNSFLQQHICPETSPHPGNVATRPGRPNVLWRMPWWTCTGCTQQQTTLH